MKPPASPEKITQILAAWHEGDSSTLAQLTSYVYQELHRTARIYLANEKAGHVLQPTAWVNEAFLRLMEWQPKE